MTHCCCLVLKNKIKLLFSLFFITLFFISPAQNSIWFKQPASQWSEGLPIGNGMLGGMIFGNPEYERVQLNEETIWTGSHYDYTDKKEAYRFLPKIREMLFDGEYSEAEQLCRNEFMGNSNWNMYQMLGDLYLKTEIDGEVTDYRRELDLEHAIATTTYSVNDVTYSREYFSSHPAKALFIRITTDKPGALSVSASLQRPKDAVIKATGDEITMEGQVTSGGVHIQNVNPGVRYYSILKVLPDNGNVKIQGDSLLVSGASDVVFVLAASTDYWGENPEKVCREDLDNALRYTYSEIKKAHVDDYRSLYSRVKLDLGDSKKQSWATDQRLEALKAGEEDNGLIETYFNFGRYLLISSSRQGDLAANLQGIWADGLTPPKNAGYHINVNSQMNYWPAEVTNLAECHLPFIALIDNLRRHGRETAREMYNSRGFVSHSSTDAWYWTTAVGDPGLGMFPMSAAWGCHHLWQHYLFTEDEAYLEKVYPVMKEASLFFVDYLTKNPGTGYLVTGPSGLPVKMFGTHDDKIPNIFMGATLDMTITRELMTNTINAAKILHTDRRFRKDIEEIVPRLSPLQIGSDGQIMERADVSEKSKDEHRYMFHLYGLYPGNEIAVKQNPEFIKAARNTIDYNMLHGGEYSGGSRAWIVNFFARLHDGGQAYENLLILLRKSTSSNLINENPPFQLDGNLGGTAGIAEMLLQSHAGEIHLLPALPVAWKSGKVEGLKARGNFEVDIEWENGKLTKAVIKSLSGSETNLRYGEILKKIDIEEGTEMVVDFN